LSWEIYYEKNKGRPLRPLYSQAVSFLNPSAKKAADLGCGVGTEVLDLLQRGFEVHALDQEAKSIEHVTQLTQAHCSRLHTHISSLENWEVWPKVDFLFAYHSFPFCSADQFDAVIEKSLSSVAPGGIYAVSFFGPEDEWVKENKVVGISADDVKEKLHGFNILHFEEIKKIGPTVLQGRKMWNIIDVIARRKTYVSAMFPA